MAVVRVVLIGSGEYEVDNGEDLDSLVERLDTAGHAPVVFLKAAGHILKNKPRGVIYRHGIAAIY